MYIVYTDKMGNSVVYKVDNVTGGNTSITANLLKQESLGKME